MAKVHIAPADKVATVVHAGAGSTTDTCNPLWLATNKMNVVIAIDASGTTDVAGVDVATLVRGIYKSVDLGTVDISQIRVRAVGSGEIGIFPDPNEATGVFEYSTNGGGAWTLVPGTLLFSSAAAGQPHANLDIHNWWIEVRGSGRIIEG